jgi:hypothetical protein
VSKRTKKRKPPIPARFKVGERVRVKHGTKDCDRPDFPLGGWAGSISEVRGLYLVRWSRETLASIHPIYKKRCAIDGDVLEEYRFAEGDLEPDPGGPLAIEQPTAITPRPLSAKIQGDRARMVFGLTSDDFLPAVDEDSLETYYDHLVEHMTLPIEAKYRSPARSVEPSPSRRVTVVALDHEAGWDEDEGILCEIRTVEGNDVVPLMDLELRQSDPNYQLLDDFSAWFNGDLSADEDEDDYDDLEDDEAQEFPEATWRSAASTFLGIIALAVSFGAAVGATTAVMPWARWAACICCGAWGLIAVISVARQYGRFHLALPPLFILGVGVIRFLNDVVDAALVGISAVAFLGAVPGGIAVFVMRRLVHRRKWLTRPIFSKDVLFAAALGATAEALCLDRASATSGLAYGASIGLASGLCLCLLSFPFAFLAVRHTSRHRIAIAERVLQVIALPGRR